ncbi:MAG: hypothetical protein HY859_17675 [Caulobacterales bacterium]|nr:hypothetical protein [Caulobacterales bacterium]
MIDLASSTWRRAAAAVVPRGYPPSVCLSRLASKGRVRRLQRGLYVPIDPVRETPVIAIASGIFADVPHYVTTDAALVHHGLLDQPVPLITVVMCLVRRPILIDATTRVRPVTLQQVRVTQADAFETSVEGFSIRVAGREQAVVDGLAEPRWMIHGDLLPEVLAAVPDEEVERWATIVLRRTTAAAQRLGYLLEDAGRRLPEALAALHPVRAVRLRPQRRARGPYSTRWRVHG